MSEAVRVLGISGSLRKGSFNTALLRAAIALRPGGVADRGRQTSATSRSTTRTSGRRASPPPVVKLRAQIAAADALLIVTPEYNYSVPGVLKNAIDWASRPAERSPSPARPLAIMGASGSVGGTMRAQYHLRQIAVYLDMHPLNKPEIFVTQRLRAPSTPRARLTDETTKKLVGQQLDALARWARKLRARRVGLERSVLAGARDDAAQLGSCRAASRGTGC